MTLLKISFKIQNNVFKLVRLSRDIPVSSVRRMWPGSELRAVAGSCPRLAPARTSPGQASKAKMAATQLLCASTRYGDF